jgi:hypothetical protein
MCTRARTHRLNVLAACATNVHTCIELKTLRDPAGQQGGAAHEGAPLAPVVPLTPLDTPVPVTLLGVYPVAPVAPVPLQQEQLNVILVVEVYMEINVYPVAPVAPVPLQQEQLNVIPVSGVHMCPKWTL